MISDDARRLIAAAIPSVSHLEVLVLLVEQPDMPWSSQALAERLYVPVRTADRLVEDLVAAGLVECNEGEERRACLLEGAVAPVARELVAVYSRNVVEVSRLIHARETGAAQRLADAFRINRKS